MQRGQQFRQSNLNSEAGPSELFRLLVFTLFLQFFSLSLISIVTFPQLVLMPENRDRTGFSDLEPRPRRRFTVLRHFWRKDPSPNYDNTTGTAILTRINQVILTKYTPLETPKQWKPRALRISVLLAVVVITGGLIAILQVTLLKSRANGGVVLAEKLSDAPLSQTFVYLYLPTILAVLYSLLWTWIDLDAKR